MAGDWCNFDKNDSYKNMRALILNHDLSRSDKVVLYVFLFVITFFPHFSKYRHSYQQQAITTMTTGIVNHNYQPGGVYYTTGQMQQLQGQVNEVTDIMRNNIRLELERGTNLDNLQTHAEDMNHVSQQFAHTSGKVKNKYWWKNCRMWVLIITIVVLILVIIIVFSVLAAQNKL